MIIGMSPMIKKIVNCPKPVVNAINGVAAGGGAGGSGEGADGGGPRGDGGGGGGIGAESRVDRGWRPGAAPDLSLRV